MSDKTKIILGIVLAGAALLIVAGPIGNLIGHLSSSPSDASDSPVAGHWASASQKTASPLPQLHLKREMVKSTVPVDDTPTLPPAKNAPADNPKTLTNNEIDAAIQQRQPQFLRCWTQRLKDNPGLVGKMDVQFEIFPRGKVQGVRVIDSTIEDDTMSRCIVSVLERIQFREFRGASITLTFPLKFE